MLLLILIVLLGFLQGNALQRIPICRVKTATANVIANDRLNLGLDAFLLLGRGAPGQAPVDVPLHGFRWRRRGTASRGSNWCRCSRRCLTSPLTLCLLLSLILPILLLLLIRRLLLHCPCAHQCVVIMRTSRAEFGVVVRPSRPILGLLLLRPGGESRGQLRLLRSLRLPLLIDGRIRRHELLRGGMRWREGVARRSLRLLGWSCC